MRGCECGAARRAEPRRPKAALDPKPCCAGLGIGLGDKGEHTISQVAPGGISDSVVAVGDVITEINGKAAGDLDHDGIMSIVRDVKRLKLTVERPAAAGNKCVTAELTRSSKKDSWGLAVGVGATASDHLISKVEAGGRAEGKLRTGDWIRACEAQPCCAAALH